MKIKEVEVGMRPKKIILVYMDENGKKVEREGHISRNACLTYISGPFLGSAPTSYISKSYIVDIYSIGTFEFPEELISKENNNYIINTKPVKGPFRTFKFKHIGYIIITKKDQTIIKWKKKSLITISIGEYVCDSSRRL